MTIAMLEQFDALRREAALWTRELETLQKKKDDEPAARHAERLQARITRTQKMLAEIDDFIDSLSDSQLRQIVQYHYVNGFSWVKTARLIGGANTADGVRKRVTRFFASAA